MGCTRHVIPVKAELMSSEVDRRCCSYRIHAGEQCKGLVMMRLF